MYQAFNWLGERISKKEKVIIKFSTGSAVQGWKEFSFCQSFVDRVRNGTKQTRTSRIDQRSDKGFWVRWIFLYLLPNMLISPFFYFELIGRDIPRERTQSYLHSWMRSEKPLPQSETSYIRILRNLAAFLSLKLRLISCTRCLQGDDVNHWYLF